MAKNQNNYIGTERVCESCGKSFFIPAYCDGWAYKADFGNKTFFCCSYHCVSEFDKVLEEKRKRSRMRKRSLA